MFVYVIDVCLSSNEQIAKMSKPDFSTQVLILVIIYMLPRVLVYEYLYKKVSHLMPQIFICIIIIPSNKSSPGNKSTMSSRLVNVYTCQESGVPQTPWGPCPACLFIWLFICIL